MLRKAISAVLALTLLLVLLPSPAMGAGEDSGVWFRAMPGYTCFPLVADNEDIPGRFLLDAPVEWDGGDYSFAYGVPTVIALQDEVHMVLVCELDIVNQVLISIDPNSPLASFLEEGRSVTRGESTEDSRILETFDLHGLSAVRVEMVGQGFEMIWIEDDGDLWFFMYPTDPGDREYTGIVADMVDSFTVFHAASIGDAPAEAFEYTADEHGVTITRYIGQAAYVHVPAKINGKPVVAVGDGAFYETGVREVTFPDTVTELGTFVFSGCTGLAAVALPARLTTLPVGTFESCFRLWAPGLNDGLTRIETSVFWGNNYLRTLTLPDSLEEIEEQNFIMNGILSRFAVSENSAGFSANAEGTILFSKDGKRLLHYGMENYASAYAVPEGVESIDPYAFYGVAHLDRITLPGSLRSIGGMALALTGVRELTIPECVTELGIMPRIPAEGSGTDTAYCAIGNETVIRGIPGSPAEEYAARQNKTFFAVEETTPAE